MPSNTEVLAGGIAGACSNAPDPSTSARDEDDLRSETGTPWHVDRETSCSTEREGRAWSASASARELVVEGGELAVHFSARGSLVLVTSHYARGALAAAASAPVRCAMMESCKGPNDRLPQVCAAERTSVRVSCGHDDAVAAPPGRGPVTDGGNALADGRDSCAGRVDGVYCSAIVPSSAIVCEGQQIAGGLHCLGEQRCVGPNGPGKDVECR